jgi:hypothetical protein
MTSVTLQAETHVRLGQSSPAVIFVILGLLISSGTANNLHGQGDAYPLAWRLSVADRFAVHLVQQKTTVTRVDKREVKIESSTTIRQNWEVVSVEPNGDYRIKQSIESIRASVGNPEFPGQALIFDTESETRPVKEAAQVLKQITPLIGLNFFVQMSPQGQIKSVTYSDETQKLLQQLPGSLDLQSLFTEDGVKDLLGAASIVLPSQPLQDDKRWEVTDSVSNPFGQYTRIRNYRLARIEGQDATAVIEFSTAIEPKKVADLPDEKLNSFEETGEIRINLKNGFVQSSRSRSITQVETKYSEIALYTTVESVATVTLEALTDPK